MFATNPIDGPEQGIPNPLDGASFESQSESGPEGRVTSEPIVNGSQSIIRQAREQVSSEQNTAPDRPQRTLRTPDVVVEQAMEPQSFRAIESLQQAIWGFTDREIIPDFLQGILTRTGSIVMIAYDRNAQTDEAQSSDKGKPVGFSISVLSRDNTTGENYLYMDLLGVHPEYQSSGIGQKLQAELARTALGTGITQVRGTFDPMETRNARVYLNGIGARVIAFQRNYYGQDYATEYEQLETHRFTALWPLVNSGPPQFPDHSVDLIEIQQDGVPRIKTAELQSNRDHYVCSVPTNFREIKAQNLERARIWQDAIANVSEALLGSYEIENFRINRGTGYGEYLFLKKQTSS